MTMHLRLRQLAALLSSVALLLGIFPAPSRAAETAETADITETAEFADPTAGAISLPLSGWTGDEDWFETSSWEIRDGLVIVHSYGGNVFSVTQKVPVKPHTDYRIRAKVRMEGYRPTEGEETGASVLFGTMGDDSVWVNDFVTSPYYQESRISFNSGDSSVVSLSLIVGRWGGACAGTAYFKDVVLEEVSPAEKDNHWNILGLIYKNVDAPGFKKSFSPKEVNELKRVLKAFPAAVENLSDSRMIIDRVDTVVIDEPVKTVSGGGGDLTYGPGGDIDFDAYLYGQDYQLIVVYAPVIDGPNFDGWLGLGGGWYEFNGRIIYYLIIDAVLDIGILPYEYRGARYDWDTSCLLHETLHCVESNSSFNGWDGYAPVHDNADHGYAESDIDWLDWYSALMRDDGLDGMGFKPESFLVPHYVPTTIPGDVNGDERVTPLDRLILTRYLAGWAGYEEKADLTAADIDGDGKVSAADRVILSRYLGAWEGYEGHFLY